MPASQPSRDLRDFLKGKEPETIVTLPALGCGHGGLNWDIVKAKMLRFTDMTLEEIAIAVGMNGGNYFSRMFKKIEGISPREYRKQW